MFQSIEQRIKSSYNCLFKQSDWILFKEGADNYLKIAALLKKRNINNSKLALSGIKSDGRLLIRNTHKRLFIGIACELIIKAYYLKNGFCINRVNGTNDILLFEEINDLEVNSTETYTLNKFVQGLPQLERKCNKEKTDKDIITAITIGKVFRNKEAHIITSGHKYSSGDYETIENGISKIYKNWFDEDLDFKISFETGEKGKFELIRNIEAK